PLRAVLLWRLLLRRRRLRRLQHQVLSAETAACSWAVRLSSVKLLTIKTPASRVAPAISTPMSGEYHGLLATLISVKGSTTDGRRPSFRLAMASFAKPATIIRPAFLMLVG